MAALILATRTAACAQPVTPADALDRYLADQGSGQTVCAEPIFAVQIDASLPALKKHGTMTGLRWIIQPGRIVYRGLRFTGDNLVKTQVIARFLARETNPAEKTQDTGITPLNYSIRFDRVSDYNGLKAYVFQLRPRRKRVGLFRGELWLDTQTAAPLRLWGDLVKLPSIFVRSLRFVQDYQTIEGCTEPLRLLLTTRTLIAGTAEMTVWMRPAALEPDALIAPPGPTVK